MLIKVGVLVLLAIGLFFFWLGRPSNQQIPIFIPQKPVALTHTFNTLPSLVQADFTADVAPEDKNFVIQGISAMDFYLHQWFGKSINQPVGLRIATGAPANEGEGAQLIVEGGKSIISMETGSFVWKRQIQSNSEIGGEWRPRISAHEYVHVYQLQNGCGQGILTGHPVAPKWFIEGEADWLSFKATKETGWLPQATIPQLILPPAKQVKGSLQSFENPNNSDFSSYFLFNMAVDYLMKDKPIKTLDDFCTNLKGGMSSVQAFNKTFGISLDQFYNNFEAYRKTW